MFVVGSADSGGGLGDVPSFGSLNAPLYQQQQQEDPLSSPLLLSLLFVRCLLFHVAVRHVVAEEQDGLGWKTNRWSARLRSLSNS